MEAARLFERLMEIMTALRAGCPWDRRQTPSTLKPYIIEEAYELLEAIEHRRPERIKEELGDLLMQIVFQAEIAREKGQFDIRDVIEGISEKMLSRHPHVFGTEELKTPEEVIERWQEHKKREGKLAESILEGVPSSLPALLRAEKIQKRASRVGFDWQEAGDAVKKLEEEVSELKRALIRRKKGGKNKNALREEMGDILFSFVNISRLLGISPEDALRKTTGKFIRRFRYIERKAKKSGRRLDDMTLREMDALWEEAKKKKAKRSYAK